MPALKTRRPTKPKLPPRFDSIFYFPATEKEPAGLYLESYFECAGKTTLLSSTYLGEGDIQHDGTVLFLGIDVLPGIARHSESVDAAYGQLTAKLLKQIALPKRSTGNKRRARK